MSADAKVTQARIFTRMHPRDYKQLHVWQRGMRLVADIYRLTAAFPATERYGLTSQLRRSGVSVPVNIAEGHGRFTPGEFVNSLSVANGSLNEMETLLILSSDLNFLTKQDIVPACLEMDELHRMIAGLRQSRSRSRR